MTSPKLPRALIVTRNLPPLVGGMERLIWHIALALRESQTVHVVGPSKCRQHLPPEVTTKEIPIRPMPSFLLGAAIQSFAFALKTRPNLVLAGSGLTAPIAWFAALLAGASSVVYLHGLDIEVQHPIYRLLWRPFFRHFDHVLVNSSYTYSLAVKAGIPANRIEILHPGVTLPDLSVAQFHGNQFRSHFNLGPAPLMLCVGRINTRKGLSVFVRHILPLIIAAVPGAQLVVIGDEPKNALKHTPGEWEKVKQALEENSLADSVHFLGSQDDDTLSKAYMAANALVFPVQEVPGDIEGFGMVAIEAAAHNLPTVAFAVGGVPDAIKEGVSGNLIPAGNNVDFAQAVIRLLTGEPNSIFPPREFAKSFCWEIFGERLRSLIPKK